MFTDLLRLQTEKGEVAIEETAQWWERQRRLLRRVWEVVGKPPIKKVALRPKVAQEDRCEGYLRRKVSFQVGKDERASAYLMVPEGIAAPAPAVLALHQTVAEGKDEPAGLAGSPDLACAHHLAQRGFVVLALDHFVAGERIPGGSRAYETAKFYERYPSWSAIGKAVWDEGRALDYLQSLDFVDPKRIGAIGHSLGGHGTVYLMALDERVVCGVCSCGLMTFVGNPDRLEWSRDHWYIYLPSLRKRFLRDELPPFDLHELLAAIAPRPLLDCSGLNDPLVKNPEAVTRAWEEAATVYAFLRVPQNFARFVHGDGHAFKRPTREIAYAWLERHLMKSPDQG